MKIESIDAAKQAAGYAAVDFIKDGMTVGLGTGSTAHYFITKLAERCREGLKVQAIPTSAASEKLARDLQIPLASLFISTIDIAVDGADEIDSSKQMVKGGGGALFREKVVAYSAKELIIIADGAKCVSKLGKFGLPIALLPFGHVITIRNLEKLGYEGVLRKDHQGGLYRSDDGMLIFDIKFQKLREDPVSDHIILSSVPGVVETGLFLNMHPKVIIGSNDGTHRVY